MNDTTLTQLKILVERVVRPVRASIVRKRKMREELLAHVMAVFEEEAKAGDEHAALERTALRFGSADALTQQLQASVPMCSRVDGQMESLIGFPPRGSMFALALRHAGLMLAMTTVGQVLVIGVQIALSGYWHEWLTLYRLPSLLAPAAFALLMFIASLLGQGMLRACLGPRSWPKLIALGLASWLLIPVWLLIMCSAITGSIGEAFLDLLPVVPSSLLAPLCLALIVRACLAEVRHCNEWAGLKLD